MKSLIDMIVCYEGREYRLVNGQDAPDMPVDLRGILVKEKHIEGVSPEKKEGK